MTGRVVEVCGMLQLNGSKGSSLLFFVFFMDPGTSELESSRFEDVLVTDDVGSC